MRGKNISIPTLEEVVEIIGEVVDLSGLSPGEDSLLGEDIPVDSRDMMRILSRLESRRKFRFSPPEIAALRTVGDLLEAIRRHA